VPKLVVRIHNCCVMKYTTYLIYIRHFCHGAMVLVEMRAVHKTMYPPFDTGLSTRIIIILIISEITTNARIFVKSIAEQKCMKNEVDDDDEQRSTTHFTIAFKDCCNQKNTTLSCIHCENIGMLNMNVVWMGQCILCSVKTS
jgi:hypothetical protein